MYLTRNLRTLSSLLLFLVPLGPAFGQEFRATLNGRVTDAQGGVVPGAKISVVNQESQAHTDTVSGSDGFLRSLAL
jgi:hypothetical protein